MKSCRLIVSCVLICYLSMVASAQIDNGGILSGTANGDVYFKSGRPWIDVRAYGAVGDGVADDTSPFQSAFNAWKTGSYAGRLYIPPGTYLITTSINATGATYGGVVEGAGVSSVISCQLAAGTPCLDFTGSQYVVVRDVQIVGSATGLQSAAILNARAQSNTRGDFPLIENVLVQGTFSKAVFANISADQGTYNRNIVASGVTVPVNLFLGCSDVLGVTSAYQSFAGVAGCTYYHVADDNFGVTTPTTTANVSTISQSTTVLTVTVPAASPVAVGQSFTLSGTLSSTANTLTVLTSTQGVISGTTSASHGFVVGDRIVIAGVTPSALNNTCTVATVPTGTTFTCNAGAGLSDTTGTVFGTVTRTWDEAYVAATVSGSTITATMATSVSDTGSAVGTIEISGEGIRTDGVGALQIDSTYFGFGGNPTAAVRITGNVATNIKMRNVRLEGGTVPFGHVIDAYLVGFGQGDVEGRFVAAGSMFRAGVGQTISRMSFKVFTNTTTKLLFDGGASVSQSYVTDTSTTNLSFNIGSNSTQNYFIRPTGKSKQFVGSNSIVVDGTGTWTSAGIVEMCLYDTETCATTGRLNLPNNKYIYEKNAAGNADVGLIGLDSGNNIHINAGTLANTYIDGGVFGWNTDNASDLGLNGNHRPRNAFVAAALRAGIVAADQGTAQTSGNIALTSGWSTSTVGTVSGFTNFERWIVTVAGTPAASPVITVTWPIAFPSAPVCQYEQEGGTFGVVTNPSITTTTAAATLTFSGTPVAAQTYTMTLVCGL